MEEEYIENNIIEDIYSEEVEQEEISKEQVQKELKVLQDVRDIKIKERYKKILAAKKYRPWQYQQHLKKLKIIEPQDIINMAKGIQDGRRRTLFILTYLTGGRISEIVGQNGLIKKNIEFIKIGDKEILKIEMRNEKNRERFRKIIPIVMDKEKELIDLLTSYLNNLNPEDVLFNFKKSRAYQLIREVSNFNPHFLRHLRASHLVTKYNFSDQKLVQYLGWTDSRPAKHYIHLKWEDLI
jgi:integrase